MSSDLASPPPSKKSRIDRACPSCVASKTRCEDLGPSGCRRCRARNVVCSTPSLPDAGANTVTQATVDELLRRVGDLEGVLSSLSTPPAKSTAQSAVQALAPTSRRATIGFSLRLLGESILPPPFNEGYFSAASQDGYPNVVALGLMSREQVHMAFHAFKNRFATLIPLFPYNLAITHPPTHPFLVLATLLHVPFLAPADLVTLLERSLIHAHSGASSTEAVLALLVLSLAPHASTPEGQEGPGLSPLVAISSAYEMGIRLGLEEATQMTLEEDWTVAARETEIQEALLWETVKSRYAILHLMLARFSPSFLPSSNVARLPLPCNEARAIVEHLHSESRVIDAAVSCAKNLARAEAQSRTRIPDDLEEMLVSWKGFCDTMDRYRESRQPGGGTLRYDIQLLTYTLSFRLSCFYQQLPSPMLPEARLPGIHVIGGKFMHLCVIMIETILSHSVDELRALPAYIVTSLALALLTARRTINYIARRHPEDTHRILDGRRVGLAYDRIERCGGVVALMLGAEVGGALWAENVGRDVGGPGLNGAVGAVDAMAIGSLDAWFDFDFSSWPAAWDGIPGLGIGTPVEGASGPPALGVQGFG